MSILDEGHGLIFLLRRPVFLVLFFNLCEARNMHPVRKISLGFWEESAAQDRV